VLVHRSSFLFHLAQSLPEQSPRARQPGHDRAYRDLHGLRNLLVGQLFQLSEDNHFAKAGRKPLDRLIEANALQLGQQQPLGVVFPVRRRIDKVGVTFLIELDVLRTMPSNQGRAFSPRR
jgi:hypothetical protein